MNFKPKLWKWYKVYNSTNGMINYRLFYYIEDVAIFIEINEKYEQAEKGYDIPRYLKNKGKDYILINGIPSTLHVPVVKFIFEELYEV